MDAETLKDNLIKIIDEAILVNQDHLVTGPGASDFAEYKYMQGTAHTLADMKSRIEDEYKNLYKQGPK
jgi:hypothetical protein